MLVNIRFIPNILTSLRIIMVPILIYIFLEYDEYTASIVGATLFALTCVTDFLDGYISRKYNVVSDFGAMLDPIADKIVVVAALFILVSFNRMSMIPAIIICSREFLVSGLRDYLAKRNIALPVTNLAKWKTFSQMSALFLLMLGEQLELFPYQFIIANYLLWLAVFLTIWTCICYVKKAANAIF